MVDRATAADGAWADISDSPETLVLTAGGDWRVAHISPLFERLDKLGPANDRAVTIDLARLDSLDTAGAWLIHRTAKRLREIGARVSLVHAGAAHQLLLDEVAGNDAPCRIEPVREPGLVTLFSETGAGTMAVLGGFANVLGFAGALAQSLFVCVINPFRLRFTSLVHHMEQVGLRALPIIALISFLIGVVIAYLGAQQLKDFGAEVWVVDLLAISILRELGVLITAIVIAGRSASAFAAQLGAMKMHEEVDALRVLGLDPMELLVLPRVLALLLTLPMLAFVSDMLGLFGGGVMCWLALDIPPELFLDLLNQTLTAWTFWIGMIKAPAFAIIIAITGCYQGMQVAGSAESVGQRTTTAVVVSIFLIIIVSAVFSVFFATMDI